MPRPPVTHNHQICVSNIRVSNTVKPKMFVPQIDSGARMQRPNLNVDSLQTLLDGFKRGRYVVIDAIPLRTATVNV
jgi:hypothetical protein